MCVQYEDFVFAQFFPLVLHLAVKGWCGLADTHISLKPQVSELHNVWRPLDWTLNVHKFARVCFFV